MKKEFINWKKGQVVDQNPTTPEKEIIDDEELRLESERKFKEKKGQQVMSKDEILDREIIDEDTENFEDLIIEDIDANRPAEEYDSDDFSAKEFEEAGEFVSKNKNYLPYKIWKIKRKYSLPRKEWIKLSKEEQIKRNRKKQEEINELYIKRPVSEEKKTKTKEKRVA